MTAADLQAVLARLVQVGAPDAIAAVVTPDGIWSGAAGVDGPDGRDATPKDATAISSVGKMFVAALVMRLGEEGRIDLEAPLTTYLGSLPVDANGATVRQALAMRTGIADTIGGTLDRVYADCDHVWTQHEIVATFPEPRGTAGGAFAYSNPTYKLLGWAAEGASGMSLAEALRTEIIEPAGVDRIIVQDVGTKAPAPLALPIAGHEGGIALERYGADGVLPCVADASFTVASGSSIAADMPSLARWGWELFGGRIVSPGSLARMLPPTDADGYGLGIDSWLDFGVPTVGHSGGKAGYKTILAYQPRIPAVVALTINDGEADEISAARQIFAALSDR